MFPAGEQLEQRPAGTDPGGGGGAGSQNSGSASALLSLMPSDFLDSVPHKGTRQCCFTTPQSLHYQRRSVYIC